MQLCQFIKVIATNTANKIPKDYVHQRIFLSTIALMPMYAEIQALDIWEQACDIAQLNHRNYQPLSDEMEKLIAGIYELATLNLYTAYNQHHTEQAWQVLKAQFLKQHIAFPDYYDLSQW